MCNPKCGYQKCFNLLFDGDCVLILIPSQFICFASSFICFASSLSVLPVLSKVIERHVHDTLYSYLCDNNLIYPKQCGFRRRLSTETALIKIIDELLFNLDKDRVSGMILIDYCNAFDMVR